MLVVVACAGCDDGVVLGDDGGTLRQGSELAPGELIDEVAEAVVWPRIAMAKLFLLFIWIYY